MGPHSHLARLSQMVMHGGSASSISTTSNTTLLQVLPLLVPRSIGRGSASAMTTSICIGTSLVLVPVLVLVLVFVLVLVLL